MPSQLFALSYLIVITTTSTVVIGIMLSIAGTTNYTYDPHSCSCECFDRKFKGLHFNSTDQYRHVYFNMTSSTMLIFVWSGTHFAMLLAFVNRAIESFYVTLNSSRKGQAGRLRWYVLTCAIINFYGLVYGWWVMFNYLNDAKHWSEMGVLWPTQLFFSLTDLVPAYMSYVLLAQGPAPPNSTLRMSVSISIAHIFLALWDQGAVNILTGSHLAPRDMMFFASDVAGILIVAPYTEFKSCGGVKWIGLSILTLSTFYLSLKRVVNSR